MGLLRTVVFERGMKLIRLNIQLNLLEATGTRVEVIAVAFCDKV